MTTYNKITHTVKNTIGGLRAVKVIAGSVIVVSTMIMGGYASAATAFSGAVNVGTHADSALIQTAGFQKPALSRAGFKRHHKRNFRFKGHRGFGKRFGYGNRYYGGGFKHHSFKSNKHFGFSLGFRHGLGHGLGHKSKKFFGKGHRRGFRNGSRGFGFRARRGRG